LKKQPAAYAVQAAGLNGKIKGFRAENFNIRQKTHKGHWMFDIGLWMLRKKPIVERLKIQYPSQRSS
jgi:hypothetical protein